MQLIIKLKVYNEDMHLIKEPKSIFIEPPDTYPRNSAMTIIARLFITIYVCKLQLIGNRLLFLIL